MPGVVVVEEGHGLRLAQPDADVAHDACDAAVPDRETAMKRGSSCSFGRPSAVVDQMTTKS